MANEYDVIVVGGGPAGEHCAGKLRGKGLSVVLVEEELIGGECSYWACIPSKTLLRPVHLLAEAKRVPGVASMVSGSVDVEAALARRNYMTSDWDDAGQVTWLAHNGIDLLRGHGRLSGERTVEVEGPDGERTTIMARKAVVLDVGTSASLPPIPGLTDAHPWTNREVLESSTVPRRLVIIGGGVVGVEMASAWRGLGSEAVTILEVGPRLLAAVEPFAAEAVAAALTRDGVDLQVGVTISSVGRSGDRGEVTVTLGDGSVVVADEILVAAGRRPRTADIGLEHVGLEPGKSIAVDDALRAVGVDDGWLFVVGDANGRALLTHMGKYQGRVIAEVVSGGTMRDRSDDGAITSVIFTDPQIASVGMSERQAREAGINVRTLRTDLSQVAASFIWGEDLTGTCQLVVDVDREVIVGATFVGPPVGELLHAATIAVVGEVPLSVLRHAVAAFPTLCEIWLELVESYFAA